MTDGTKAKINERMLSALIGLARATEGNEELVTEETGQLLFQGLSMVLSDTEESEATGASSTRAHRMTELLADIREEKKRLVPNCFDCASPCGRTADYDMREFRDAEQEQIDLKLSLVKRLAEIGTEAVKCGSTDVETRNNCLETLIVLGWNGSKSSLLRVLEKIE